MFSKRLFPFVLTFAGSLALAAPAAADKLPDPPSATITAPMDGDMFDAPAVVDVTLSVYEGTGVDSIDLWVDDASVASDMDVPWGFSGVALSEGMHTIYVVVNGSDGIGYPSESISVAVLGAGETSSGTSDTNTSSGDGGGAEGCSCTASSNDRLAGALGMIFVGLLALLGASPSFVRRRDA